MSKSIKETLAKRIVKAVRDNANKKISDQEMKNQIEDANKEAKYLNMGPNEIGNLAMANCAKWEKEIEAEEALAK